MGHSVHWEVLGLLPETRETSSTGSCSTRPVKPGLGMRRSFLNLFRLHLSTDLVHCLSSEIEGECSHGILSPSSSSRAVAVQV